MKLFDKPGAIRPSHAKLISTIGFILCLPLVMNFQTGDAIAADDLCFNRVSGTSTDPAPEIDGVVTDDGGWRKSNQYVFYTGVLSLDVHAIVQMTRTNSAVYLSFEIHNDASFDALDTILLALSPDANPVNDHRIIIHPVATNAGNATSAPGGPPNEVKYWQNSSTWNSAANQPLPSWLQNVSGNIRITSSPNIPGPKSYIVEIRLPISSSPSTGINLPPSGPFELYYNIVRVVPDNPATPANEAEALAELAWPPSAPPIGGVAPAPFAVETNTPAPGDWGNGRLENDCPGVKVISVRTNHPSDPNGIDPNSTNNRFKIVVTNTGTADAAGITATIKSKRFGTGAMGSFEPIPVPPPGGPHINVGTLAAGATTPELETAAWDVLNDPDRPTYLTWPNVCSFVELNATSGLIANRFYPWNLHFSTASKFKHVAVIDAKGFDPPPQGMSRQKFDFFVETRQEELRKPDLVRLQKRLSTTATSDSRRAGEFGFGSQLGGEDQNYLLLFEAMSAYFPKLIESIRKDNVVSVYTQLVHVYRDTGRYIEIAGERFRLKEYGNSFGYVLYHSGLVSEWEHVLSSPALSQVPETSNRYVAEVEPDEFIELRTTVEAHQPGTIRRCFDWLQPQQ